MAQITEEQIGVVTEYEDYSLEDLYNLIGNQVAEQNDPDLNRRYVFGTPNVFERGSNIVRDVRASLCQSHERIEELIAMHQDIIEPIEWAATIGDVILAVTVTHGIPPWAVAVALGKLCNRTLSKLC